MKLVILEPVYFSKEHISELKTLGEVVVCDKFSGFFKLFSSVKDVDIIITAEASIDSMMLKECKALRLICTASTGYDHIDIKMASELGITVTNVPGYATDAVAEYTFALLFALLRKICKGGRYIRKNRFTRKQFRGVQLKGKTFGIIGTGAIGTRVSQIANCFGCNVVALTLNPSAEKEKRLRLKYVEMEALLKISDVISLHVSLNKLTEAMIGYDAFAHMQKKPILVNTSREEVINYNALVDALSKGLIFGAGLDTLPRSFLLRKYLLSKFQNVIFSPHVAFYTPEALNKCADTVVDNIKLFISGKSQNIVNKPDYTR